MYVTWVFVRSLVLFGQKRSALLQVFRMTKALIRIRRDLSVRNVAELKRGHRNVVDDLPVDIYIIY